MIKWTKEDSSTKEGHQHEVRKRDIKAILHKEHTAKAEEMQAEADKTTGYSESASSSDDGLLDKQGMASKAHRKKQQLMEFANQHSKKLGDMRSRIKKGRKRAKFRGRSLGF